MQKEEISFRFIWTLTDYQIDGSVPAGLLFHKWLPDGKKDEICLLKHNNIKLFVLFERRGFLSEDRIQYSDEKMEKLKEGTIRRHAKLESGPLFIKLFYPINAKNKKKIIDRNAETKKGKFDQSNDYKELGKNIYRLLYDKLSALVYTLKYKFGQFWVDDFPKWDSTEQSLGNYFNGLQAKCTIKGKKYKFLPSSPVVKLVCNIDTKDEKFLELISEADWRSIQAKKFLGKNSCREYLVKSFNSYIEKDLKNAFLEACIALELSISKLFVKFHEKRLESFFNISKKTQLCIIANLIMPDLAKSVISNAYKAIDIRNSIMHEGYTPKPRDSKCYVDFISVIKKLLKDGDIKLPNKHLGQIIRTE
jgi:hypothetical protein